jgi:hypothetical protein
MVRTCLCSLAGAGVGFLAGLALIPILAVAGGASDTKVVGIFIGVFLAGAGAVAGALIGGIADLIAFFRTRDNATRDAQAQQTRGQARGA